MSNSKSKKKKSNPTERRGSNKTFKPSKNFTQTTNTKAEEVVAEADAVNVEVTPSEVEENTQQNVEVTTNEVVATEATLTKTQIKAQKQALKDAETKAKLDEKAKAKTKDTKKPVREKKPFGHTFKETASELKKVSWPTIGETLKKTGVVIAVVLFFSIVLFGVDRLFAWLYSLFTAGI